MNTHTKPLVIVGLIATLIACVCLLAGCQSDTTYKAVYKGIAGYGTVTAEEVQKADFAGYQFEVDGQVKQFKMKQTPKFELQNQLQEGKTYTITVEKDCVTALSCEPDTSSFKPLVSGQPGEKTLTNFFRLALEPVGNVLYVYGGGWNWQDNGGSTQANSIGVAPSWTNFYQAHKGDYNYKFKMGTNNTVEDRTGYYPFGAWNEFYYAGVDCSAYIGWLLFNYNYSEDTAKTAAAEGVDYVTFACDQAKLFADQGYGTFSRDLSNLHPGDVISLPDHVWICVGTCEDGSVVVLHATVSDDIHGEMSGGVQLSAINPKDTGEDCEAFKLAQTYMQKYYPEWTSNYPVVLKDYALYTNMSDTEDGGVFCWTIGEGGAQDPDGLQGKSAAEVLEILFATAS